MADPTTPQRARKSHHGSQRRGALRGELVLLVLVLVLVSVLVLLLYIPVPCVTVVPARRPRDPAWGQHKTGGDAATADAARHWPTRVEVGFVADATAVAALPLQR